ncbi:unannotated protein [freshwater metagenome]|uniref:Unannotated protein n=1 Tax=freshwater metagenome TaxID=449393 RepID=A0A6J6AAV6_9ZZZZ
MIHHADHVVAVIGDVQVAGAVQSEIAGLATQRCVGGGSAITGVTDRTGASKRRDKSGRVIDLANHVVVVIVDVQVAGSIHDDIHRPVKCRVGGGSTITAVTHRTSASDSGDDSGRVVHPADHVVGAIGDVQIAGGGHGDPVRTVQFRDCRKAIITAVPGGTGASDSRDQAGRVIHPADHVVLFIGDVQIAGGVHRHVGDPANVCDGCHGAIRAVPPGTGPRNSGHDSGRVIDPTDHVVAAIGDVHVAGTIHGHAVEALELSEGGEAIITAVPDGAGASDRGDVADCGARWQRNCQGEECGCGNRGRKDPLDSHLWSFRQKGLAAQLMRHSETCDRTIDTVLDRSCHPHVGALDSAWKRRLHHRKGHCAARSWSGRRDPSIAPLVRFCGRVQIQRGPA